MADLAPPVTAPRTRVVWPLVLIAIVALWVAIPGLDFRSIENHEHPRFARIAQTILWDGEWIALRSGLDPHPGLDPYTNKPPLLMWLIAVFSAPFGHVNPWTARLPSALASCVGGFAMYGIGRRLASRAVGLLAALILLTAWKWTWYAHSITTDMLLSAGIAVGIYCIIRAFATERPARWWFAAGLAAGLASLAKGPIGLLVPGVVTGAFWVALGRDRPRLQPSAGFLAVGFLLVFFPWVLVLANRIGWESVWAIADRELIGRALSGTAQAQPVWYYAQKLPADFLPWTLLWPAAAVCARPARVRPEWRRAAWLAMVWAVLPVLLFSLSRGKASRFLLCAYPGVALLCALAVQDLLDRAQPSQTQEWLIRRLLIGLSIALLLGPLVLWLPLGDPRYYMVLRIGAGIGGGLALMGGYLLLVHRGPARVRVAVGIIVAACCLGHALHLRALVVVDDLESPFKGVVRRVRELAAGRPVTMYPDIDHRLSYYFAAPPLTTTQEVRDRFATGQPVACVLRPPMWAALRDDLAPWVAASYNVHLVQQPGVVVISRAGGEPPPPAAILPPDSPSPAVDRATPPVSAPEPAAL